MSATKAGQDKKVRLLLLYCKVPAAPDCLPQRVAGVARSAGNCRL